MKHAILLLRTVMERASIAQQGGMWTERQSGCKRQVGKTNTNLFSTKFWKTSRAYTIRRLLPQVVPLLKKFTVLPQTVGPKRGGGRRRDNELTDSWIAGETVWNGKKDGNLYKTLEILRHASVKVRPKVKRAYSSIGTPHRSRRLEPTHLSEAVRSGYMERLCKDEKLKRGMNRQQLLTINNNNGSPY